MMQDLDHKLKKAVSLHGQGKVSNAIVVYQEILDSDSRHFGALQHLGIAKIQIGDGEEGIRLLKRAVSINPKNSQAHYNLGLAWRNDGNKQKAQASFRRSIAIQPENFQAQNSLAGILLEYPDKLK